MKEYTDKLIFDNLDDKKEVDFSVFFLESYIRSAAQTMVQVGESGKISQKS